MPSKMRSILDVGSNYICAPQICSWNGGHGEAFKHARVAGRQTGRQADRQGRSRSTSDALP
eukprot:747096-Hanusia_phi.AAC.2